MFLTTKLNVITGIIIGATTVMVMKQICKNQKKQNAINGPMDIAEQQPFKSNALSANQNT